MLGVICLAVAAGAQTNMALPAGTAFKVKLENTLSTFSSKEGDAFSGRVVDAVMLDGKTVIPVGATVQGRVTKVNEPRRIAGKPTIGIFPEAVVLPNGERYMLNATMVDTNLRNGTDVNTEGQFKGDGHDGKDLTEIGFGTGGGMLIGGLAGGGKGSADRRSRRRYPDGGALARQKALRGAALRHGVDDGVEPSAGDDGGDRRPVAGVPRGTGDVLILNSLRPLRLSLRPLRFKIFEYCVRSDPLPQRAQRTGAKDAKKGREEGMPGAPGS